MEKLIGKRYGNRRCYKCRNIFPLTFEYFFHRNRSYFGGFDYICRECHLNYKRKRYKNNCRKRFNILKKYNFTCQYCGKKAPDVILHIDHIIPKKSGGVSTKDNLTVACEECNLGKSSIDIKI